VTARDPAQLGFDRLLQAELDKAEGKKAAAMALLIVLGIVPVVAALFVQSQFLDHTAHRPGIISAFVSVCLVLLAIEILAWLLIRRRTRAGIPLRRWPGVMMIGLEALLPTIGLALIGSFLPPTYALTAPQLLLYGVTVTSSTLRLEPRLCLLSGGISALSYAALAAWLVSGGGVTLELERAPATHVMRTTYILLLGGVAAAIAWQVRARVDAALQNALDRNRVVSVFGRYLTSDVVDHLLHAPDGLRLGGQRREITVLMTDLRGFSTLAERMPPEQVMTLLNHYLGRMIPVVMAHGGTLDEIIGDALLVLFNAPLHQADHARRAVACALSMQREMAVVNDWNDAQGLPRLEMGVGLHSGEAVVGNIGSDQRQKYGVVGSTINTAARVESATVGGQVLATARVVELAGEGLWTGERRALRPKGSVSALEVTALLGLGELRLEATDDALSPCATMPVLLQLLHGKELDPQPIAATLVARSTRALRVRAERSLEGAEDLRVTIGGASAYARVTVEAGGALLRITSAEGAAALWSAVAALPATPQGSGSRPTEG
jgi:class 3 adenylate cyclase